MKRFAFALLIGLALVSPARADDDLLQRIGQRLEHHQVTRGEFTQENHLQVLSKPLVSSGHFLYHRDKGVIWDVVQPLESRVLMNRDRVITSDRSAQTFQAGGFGEIFQAMLGGDLSVLARNFATDGEEDDTGWRLVLRPRDKRLANAIQAIRLSGDRQPEAVEIQDAAGNVTSIRLSVVDHSPRLSPDEDSDFARLAP
jgi:outer membrane lipoprotein-sorting protein